MQVAFTSFVLQQQNHKTKSNAKIKIIQLMQFKQNNKMNMPTPSD